MTDLEHDVAETPETIFEPGSVSKQFTATATILLALDGKLSWVAGRAQRYLEEETVPKRPRESAASVTEAQQLATRVGFDTGLFDAGLTSILALTSHAHRLQTYGQLRR